MLLHRVTSCVAACAASLSAASSAMLNSKDVPWIAEYPRSETHATVIQDTTKKNARSHPEVKTSEREKAQPIPQMRGQALPLTLHVGEMEFRSMTLEEADSLGRLHPELREFLLKEMVIQGGLAIDRVEFERKKIISRNFPEMKLYGELEAEMRRNQAWYGTINNPLRPPPMPNQVNLFDILPAISNLLHSLGLK